MNSVPAPITIAVALICLAGVVAALVAAIPSRRVPQGRRLRNIAVTETALSRTAGNATVLVRQILEKGGRGRRWSYALDRAGIRRPLPELILIAAAASLGGFAIGLLVSGLAVGLICAVGVVMVGVLVIALLASRRKSQFADQLDDVSQLLATNLRAGHSLLQGLGALAVEMEEPVRSELARAVNQVRVGRDLGDALGETAERMDSEDFLWVAQAIAIHRQVGGNLADVLDTVGETIRERNQVRRQVKALSAEGRMSALVLMLLPIIVGIVLSLVNPIYLTTFTESFIGWMMLATVAILLLTGGLWLRKLVQVEF